MLVSAMNNERKRSIPSGPSEWGAAGIDVEVPRSGGGTITASGNSFDAPVLAALARNAPS
jgi:hypothetical protein